MTANEPGVGGFGALSADEQIDVLRRHGEPAHFILHGRLYRVREIISHWIQVGAGSGEIPSVLLRHDWRRGAAETQVFGRDREFERELWSVRASVGRTDDAEVFQLCHDIPGSAWLRVTDTLTCVSPEPDAAGAYPDN
jgi:hypothetical protein